MTKISQGLFLGDDIHCHNACDVTCQTEGHYDIRQNIAKNLPYMLCILLKAFQDEVLDLDRAFPQVIVFASTAVWLPSENDADGINKCV